MSLRKIASDIWVIEKRSAKKTAYVGMIRLVDAGYSAWQAGQCLGVSKSLEEAEKLYGEELPA